MRSSLLPKEQLRLKQRKEKKYHAEYVEVKIFDSYKGVDSETFRHLFTKLPQIQSKVWPWIIFYFKKNQSRSLRQALAGNYYYNAKNFSFTFILPVTKRPITNTDRRQDFSIPN
jgi:hypothetical protein